MDVSSFMRDFQQKRQIRKLMYSPRVAFILLLIFVFLARGAWGAYTKERESRLNLKKIEQDYEKSLEREKFLLGEIERLNTEEGLEEEIREKFSVTKPGEEVVLVVESEESSSNEIIEEEGFWSRFFGFFKRK